MLVYFSAGGAASRDAGKATDKLLSDMDGDDGTGGIKRTIVLPYEMVWVAVQAGGGDVVISCLEENEERERGGWGVGSGGPY